ncbi:MAG: hypothetical protein QM651_09150 [Rhodoblastus sp.]
MPKVPFNLQKDFHRFDGSDINAPQIGATLREDRTRAFRIAGFALLVLFCGALGVVLTSAYG